jgi:hypothetical protein
MLGQGTRGKNRQPDLLEMLEDVSANEDEGCKVLQVHSHYIIHVLKQYRVGCLSDIFGFTCA